MHIKHYQEELKKVFITIEKNIISRKSKTLNPYTIAHRIVNLIKSFHANNEKCKQVKLKADINHLVRQWHDFYGNKAKDSANKLGCCAGAIYRTRGFLMIEPTLRSGAKKDKHTAEAVHIEHSIPCRVLVDSLLAQQCETLSAEEVFNLLVQYSLCTGFSRVEERTAILPGMSSKHPDFSLADQLPSTDKVQAFIRYKSNNVEIYSMITGEKMPLTSILSDLNQHTKKIKIFQWNFLEKHYANI